MKKLSDHAENDLWTCCIKDQYLESVEKESPSFSLQEHYKHLLLKLLYSKKNQV